MKTLEMEIALCRYFGQFKNLIVPNIYNGFFRNREADLLIITNNGYCTEVEIKISIQDFRKEFEKRFYLDNFDLADSDNPLFDERIKKKFFAFPQEVYEKNLIEINEKTPKYSGILTVVDNGIQKYSDEKWHSFTVREVRAPDDKIRSVKPRKLTDEEISSLKRLGCIRLWTIKENLLALSGNVENGRNGEE